MANYKVYPPTWSWERDGSEVSGEVLDIRHMPAKTKNGREFRETDIMTLEGPQGEVSVFLSPAGLRRWFQEENPRVGDYVSITFVGWEPILDKETNRPKPHPDDPSKVWEMRMFSATVDSRESDNVASGAPPLGGSPAQSSFDGDSDIPFAPSYV